MSLDIWLTAKVETSVVDMNMTHNVAPMWKKAGIYDALYNSEGMTAKELIPTLLCGLCDMKSKPDEYKELDSPNRCGTYRQALPWLEELVDKFMQYPDGVIGISK